MSLDSLLNRITVSPTLGENLFFNPSTASGSDPMLIDPQEEEDSHLPTTDAQLLGRHQLSDSLFLSRLQSSSVPLITYLHDAIKQPWEEKSQNDLKDALQMSLDVSTTWEYLNRSDCLTSYWKWIFNIDDRLQIETILTDQKNIYAKLLLQGKTSQQFLEKLWGNVGHLIEQAILGQAKELDHFPHIVEKKLNLEIINQILQSYLDMISTIELDCDDVTQKLIQLIRSSEQFNPGHDMEAIFTLTKEILKLRNDNKKISEDRAINLIISHKLWNEKQEDVASILGYSVQELSTLWENAMNFNSNESAFTWPYPSKEAIKGRWLKNKNLWIYALLNGKSKEIFFRDLQNFVDIYLTLRLRAYLYRPNEEERTSTT